MRTCTCAWGLGQSKLVSDSPNKLLHISDSVGDAPQLELELADSSGSRTDFALAPLGFLRTLSRSPSALRGLVWASNVAA